jgi:hypothetical protein
MDRACPDDKIIAKLACSIPDYIREDYVTFLKSLYKIPRGAMQAKFRMIGFAIILSEQVSVLRVLITVHSYLTFPCMYNKKRNELHGSLPEIMASLGVIIRCMGIPRIYGGKLNNEVINLYSEAG